MKTFQTFAMAVALGLAGASGAQAPQAPAATYSAAERAALQPVQAAIQRKDWAAAKAALPAAEAAVRGPDALYALGRFQLEVGLGLSDVRMQARGLDALVASGRVPPAEMPVIYRNIGVLANNAGDKAKAEAAFANVVELSPADPEALISLAQLKNERGKGAEAVPLIRKAIGLKRSAGQRVDESWYKYALKLAFDSRCAQAMRPACLELSQELVAAYPTAENLRDALLILREAGGLDAAAQTDLLRVMRATGTLAGERDWYDLADQADRAGFPAEGKSVLDQAIAAKKIDPAKQAFRDLIARIGGRIAQDPAPAAGAEAAAMASGRGLDALRAADLFLSHGEGAIAARLYAEALRKGGVDPDLANFRLGFALATQDRKAEAQAAFAKVRGSRAGLARLWSGWLGRRS